MPRGRGIHRTGDLVLVGDVGRLVSDLTALGLDLLNGGGEPVGVAADDHDRCPGGGQAGRYALADPTATAGDQVSPVFERKLHASSSLRN